MTLEPAEPSSRLPPTERSLLSMQPAVLPGAQIVRTAPPGVIPQAATMAYGRCASIPQTAAAVAER